MITDTRGDVRVQSHKGDCSLSSALRFVLAERERELLELKGPCSNALCRLHYAHAGPCHVKVA